MTREEEIDKIAIAFAIDAVIDKDTCNPESKRGLIYAGFVSGAMWSDSHPHWISVEDALPPRGRTDPNVSVPVITCKIVNRELHEIGFQQYIFGKGKWKYCDATHWMPMPEAPHHIIDANKKVDRVIGTADHIKTALDVLNKKGGKE